MGLTWAAQALTALLAFAIARRRPQHRAFAIWAVVALIADLLRLPLNAGPLSVGGPYRGSLRALFHVDEFLVLADPVGLAMLGWVSLLYKRPWVPLAAGLATWAALIVGYPRPFR